MTWRELIDHLKNVSEFKRDEMADIKKVVEYFCCKNKISLSEIVEYLKKEVDNMYQ